MKLSANNLNNSKLLTHICQGGKLLFMKRFLVILVLIFSFQIPSFADDIRDFQIEGMSIGDSALDYFSEEMINSNIGKTSYKSKKFYHVGIEDSTKFEMYNVVQLHFKKNDNKFIIHSISGNSRMEIKSCLNKQKEIYEEISELFTDIKKYDAGKRKHPSDESGKSFTYDMYFQFKSKDVIVVSCYDWSEKMSAADKLLIAIDTKEFNDFLNNEAHK